jgi:hypothetical protein
MKKIIEGGMENQEKVCLNWQKGFNLKSSEEDRYSPRLILECISSGEWYE